MIPGLQTATIALADGGGNYTVFGGIFLYRVRRLGLRGLGVDQPER